MFFRVDPNHLTRISGRSVAIITKKDSIIDSFMRHSAEGEYQVHYTTNAFIRFIPFSFE